MGEEFEAEEALLEPVLGEAVVAEGTVVPLDGEGEASSVAFALFDVIETLVDDTVVVLFVSEPATSAEAVEIAVPLAGWLLSLAYAGETLTAKARQIDKTRADKTAGANLKGALINVAVLIRISSLPQMQKSDSNL